MDARFPVPRYIIADQHKSEARFLICKLNPARDSDVHAARPDERPRAARLWSRGCVGSG